jgi:hypothetical protein
MANGGIDPKDLFFFIPIAFGTVKTLLSIRVQSVSDDWRNVPRKFNFIHSLVYTMLRTYHWLAEILFGIRSNMAMRQWAIMPWITLEVFR